MSQNEEENVTKSSVCVQSFLSEKAKSCVEEVQLQKMFTELSLRTKESNSEYRNSTFVNHRHKMFLPGIERGYTLTEIDTRKRDIFKLKGDNKFPGIRREMTFSEATEFKKDYKESIPALIPLDTTKLQFSVCGKKLKNEDVKNELQKSWSQERSLTLPNIARCFSPRLSKEPVKFKPQKFSKHSVRRGKRTNKLMKSKTFIAMSENLIEETSLNVEPDLNNNPTTTEPAAGKIGKGGKIMIDKSTMTDAYLWPNSPRTESDSVSKSSALVNTEHETQSIGTIVRSITENSTCGTKTIETNTDLIESYSLPEISIVMAANTEKTDNEKECSVSYNGSSDTKLSEIDVSRKSESSNRSSDRDTLPVKEKTIIYDNTKTGQLPETESTQQNSYLLVKHSKTSKAQRPQKSRKSLRRTKIKPFGMAKSRTYVNIHVTSS